eukprot:NODE_738_length_4335_cov_0.481350.p3 type:complete len:201 gc:universal NODE_738_length_4335_cov_0.481350:3-605(+)
MCQLSISYKTNPTWKDFVIIEQWDHSCPDAFNQWTIKLPTNLPSGDIVVAFTWFNAWWPDNQPQFYTNCFDLRVSGNVNEKGLSGICPLVSNILPNQKLVITQDSTCPNCGTKKYMGKKGNPLLDSKSITVTPATKMTCIDKPYASILPNQPLTNNTETPTAPITAPAAPNLPAAPIAPAAPAAPAAPVVPDTSKCEKIK